MKIQHYYEFEDGTDNVVFNTSELLNADQLKDIRNDVSDFLNGINGYKFQDIEDVIRCWFEDNDIEFQKIDLRMVMGQKHAIFETVEVQKALLMELIDFRLTNCKHKIKSRCESCVAFELIREHLRS